MSKEQKDLEIKANELGKEISDDEIEAATGGGKCFCLIAGYGHYDDENANNHPDAVCVCAVIGLSKFQDELAMRCQCAIAGGGVSY